MVQGGPRERVKGIFYQKDDNTKDTASTTQPTPTTVAARPAPTTCEN